MTRRAAGAGGSAPRRSPSCARPTPPWDAPSRTARPRRRAARARGRRRTRPGHPGDPVGPARAAARRVRLDTGPTWPLATALRRRPTTTSSSSTPATQADVERLAAAVAEVGPDALPVGSAGLAGALARAWHDGDAVAPSPAGPPRGRAHPPRRLVAARGGPRPGGRPSAAVARDGRAVDLLVTPDEHEHGAADRRARTLAHEAATSLTVRRSRPPRPRRRGRRGRRPWSPSAPPASASSTPPSRACPSGPWSVDRTTASSWPPRPAASATATP